MREELRCHGCGRLLAVRADERTIVIRSRRQTVRMEQGIIRCRGCGRELKVRPRGESAKNSVD